MLWKCERRWDAQNITKATNYITLLDQIQQWRAPEEKVCIVTFNYDLMLEAALSTVGVIIRSLDDYIVSDKYKLIKLHGSVNWARELETEIDSTAASHPYGVLYEIINRASHLNVSSRYRVTSAGIHEDPLNKLAQWRLFPAITIPVQSKLDYECPGEHFEALRAFLPEVDKLLVIGWRGAETHFLETLAGALKQDIRGFVVAGDLDEASETISRLSAAGIKGGFSPFGEGFSNFVVNRAAEPLLKAY